MFDGYVLSARMRVPRRFSCSPFDFPSPAAVRYTRPRLCSSCPNRQVFPLPDAASSINVHFLTKFSFCFSRCSGFEVFAADIVDCSVRKCAAGRHSWEKVGFQLVDDSVGHGKQRWGCP